MRQHVLLTGHSSEADHETVIFTASLGTSAAFPFWLRSHQNSASLAFKPEVVVDKTLMILKSGRCTCVNVTQKKEINNKLIKLEFLENIFTSDYRWACLSIYHCITCTYPPVLGISFILVTLGEEEASSLPITAATVLGPAGWVRSTSGTELGLQAGELEPSLGLELGGRGALLFWLLPTSREGPPAGGLVGLDVFGS